MDTFTLILTILAVGVALGVQRRADLRRVNKRFDDGNKRLAALESQQREDTKVLNAKLGDLGREVSTLQGRLGEVGRMISAALQALLGSVVMRRGGQDRPNTFMEQAVSDEPD